MPILKVAVLYGGKSTEHEVSVHSAQTVCELLEKQTDKYDVLHIFIDKKGQWFLQNQCGPRSAADMPITPVIDSQFNLLELGGSWRAKVDVFFPVLHGTNGEDGILQGLLESLNVPYTGCGVLTSAMGMDKEVTKVAAWKRGINTLEYKKLAKEVPYDKAELEAWVSKIGLPVFVKPVSLGSSVGVSKVKTLEELHTAIAFAFEFDRFVMIERGVDHAREIFCAVIGKGNDVTASQCGELETLKSEFFDYEAKYVTEGGCVTRVPAEIDESAREEMQKQSVTIFKALRGSGLARVDFLMGQDGKFYFSEINTLPGLSNTSLFPQLFESSGLPYAQALDQLVEIALQVYAEKEALSLNR